MTLARHPRFLESHVGERQPFDDSVAHSMSEPGALGEKKREAAMLEI